MEKHIYNEQTGISYILQGDYYLPDLALPDEEEHPIGVWGQRYLRYIKQHRKVLYLCLPIMRKSKKNCSPQLNTTSRQSEKPNRKRLI